jgi:hypothetical protein
VTAPAAVASTVPRSQRAADQPQVDQVGGPAGLGAEHDPSALALPAMTSGKVKRRSRYRELRISTAAKTAFGGGPHAGGGRGRGDVAAQQEAISGSARLDQAVPVDRLPGRPRRLPRP